MKRAQKEKTLKSYFFEALEAEEEGEDEEEERVFGQLVEKCPVCWQEKQTTCLSGLTEERRLAG